jgi:hypothetical protein
LEIKVSQKIKFSKYIVTRFLKSVKKNQKT